MKSLSETDRKSSYLLIFVHGFMGSESSFGNFPLDLNTCLRNQWGCRNLEIRILPRFESKGHHIKAIQALYHYLLHNVVGSEYEKVILLGHSMGALILADAVRELSTKLDQERERSLHNHHLVLPVTHVVAFDSPFLGLDPSVMSDLVESYIMPSSSSEHETNQDTMLLAENHSSQPNDQKQMHGSLYHLSLESCKSMFRNVYSSATNLFTKSGSEHCHPNIKETPSSFENMRNVSDLNNLSVNPGSHENPDDALPLEFVENFQDNFEAPISDINDEAIMQKSHIDWNGLTSVGITTVAVTGGLYYLTGGLIGSLAMSAIRGMAISYGVSKVNDLKGYGQFLYPIWGETVKSRLDRLRFLYTSRLRFTCFYLSLPAKSSDSASKSTSFIHIPSKEEMEDLDLLSSFRSIGSDFDNIVLAHMNMFSRHENPGHYWLLVDQVSLLISKEINSK